MKKKIIFIYILLFVFFLLVGCEEEIKDPTLELNDITLMVGESFTISPTTNVGNAKYSYAIEGTCVSLDNNILIANETGTATLTVTLEDYNLTKQVQITCCEEGITIIGSKTVVINETTDLSLIFVGMDETDDVVWRSNDAEIARVSKGVVTGIALGKFIISAKAEGYKAQFEMEVIRPTATDLSIEDDKNEIIYEVGATYELKHQVLPELALQDVKIESNDSNVTINDDMTITTKKTGEATLKVTSIGNEKVTKTVKIKIVENENPVFTKLSNYEENIQVNFGSPLSATVGLQVTDNSDGDITDLVVTENEEELQKFGTHEITLVATDRAGNKTTFKRTVTVIWQYKTKFIGHQGCFYAVPNTEEAFLYACKEMHYQALECDLKSTKDGVLVICHDNDFGGVDIASTNYEDLAKVTDTSKSFGCPLTYYGYKQYTGHICTFDRYLDICKEYNVMPIIELKGAYGMDSSNKSQLPTLMKILKEKGLYDSAVILTSMGDCITYLRNQGETVKCQYLVNGASSDSVLNFCITNQCDVSVNVTYGNSISDEYIKKFHDAGCEVSVWTFTSYCDYPQVQEWINKGVDYITCDWQYFTKGDLVLNLKS